MKKFNFVLSGLLLLVVSATAQTFLSPEEGYKVAYYFPDYTNIGAFDVYENLLFIQDGDTIHMLDTESGEELKRFGEPADYTVANYASFLTVSPDGKSLWAGYTSDGSADDRIYSIDMETAVWEMQARFPGNFDLILWNDSILVSGLNSVTWGDPSGIFVLDTSGLDQHRRLIEVGGNSAGMALDAGGNLYYGTSYSVDPNVILRWDSTVLAGVIENTDSAPLQVVDAEKLSDLPMGANDCEVDEAGNLVFNLNQFGSDKVLAKWNGNLGEGLNFDTLSVARGDYDWLGTVKSMGNFMVPEMGNRILTFSFGQALVDVHTADYLPVMTSPVPAIYGYEQDAIETIDLSKFVYDPDDADLFSFKIALMSDSSVADLWISGDTLMGTLGVAGQANLVFEATSAGKTISGKTVVGTWPVITGNNMISDFEDLSLDPEAYWNGADGSGGFVSASARYINAYNPDWFSWSGWAYSNISDNTTPGWMNQYSAITGVGFDESANYGISYAAGPSVIGFAEDKAHAVEGFFVTNSTYAALSMEHGDDFTKKFGGLEGGDPDYFRLDIWGTKDGAGTDTIGYYLADFRPENPSDDYILKTWQWVDLSSLGKVDSLQFVLTSSDVGDWGMNTPGYFCLDQLYVIPDAAPFLANSLADMVIISDGSDTVIDISDVFSDPDDDDDVIIKILKSNSNQELLEATITGDSLTLYPKIQLVKSVAERAEIVVEATSGGLTLTDTFTVTIVFPDAIKELPNFSVQIYPNPSRGSIVIGSNTSEPLDVTILSITGTRVYENRKYVSGQAIDIGDVPPGAYIIRIKNDSGSISKMIHKL